MTSNTTGNPASNATTEAGSALELGDIQAGALMPRPNPYAGAFWALRIDDRHAGRELLRRLIPLLDPVASFDPDRPVSLAVGLSFTGLEALGVPGGVAGQLPARSSSRAWPLARTTSGTSGRTLRRTGRNRWVRRTCTWWWPRWPGTPP